MDHIQTFDGNQEYSVLWRRLPHWAQAGTICFITWRVADSMPLHVVKRWLIERAELLRRTGIDVDQQQNPRAGFSTSELSLAISRLDPANRSKLQFELTARFDEHLDACHGACMFRKREFAEIIAESLQRFDGDRYQLTDFVVMPNYVHLLAAFPDEKTQLQQCANWKRFTARKINATTNGRGAFWQEDAFDHLVRSVEHFEHYRRTSRTMVLKQSCLRVTTCTIQKCRRVSPKPAEISARQILWLWERRLAGVFDKRV